MPAPVTHLRRRKPAVYLDRLFSISLGLFLDHSNSGSNAGVAQTACKAVVLDHAAQVQIFEVDCVELADDPRAEFLESVLSRVGNFLMAARNSAFRQLPPLRSSLLSGEISLQERQPLRTFMQMLRISDVLASRKSGKPCNAKINPDALPGQRLGGNLRFDDEAGKIAPACLSNDRHARRGGRERPLHFQAQDADLGDGQTIPVAETEAGKSVAGSGARSLFLEAGITGALGEEVLKGGLKIAKRLLQHDARNLFEPSGFRLMFETGHRGVALRVGHALAVLERLGSRRQRPIVDVARAAERAGKLVFLLWRWIASVCLPPDHGLTYSAIYV